MEQATITFISALLSDFGITGALYILIIGSFIYYTPKMIDKHFATIKELQKEYSLTLDKIVISFEKKIDESNSWHRQHQDKLEKTNYRLKRIEDNLKIKD